VHTYVCGLADYLYPLGGKAGSALISRVLIADTDAALRQRLYSRLLDIDIFSDCVGTGGDAVAKLDEGAYSLVIADVAIPAHGVEHIVTRIARLPKEKRPFMLVVAASAEAARSLDVEVVQIVLRRPLNEPQLIDLISSCVRSSIALRRDRNVEAGALERGDRARPH